MDAFETFLRVPGTVTRKGSHVRDAIDLKRILIIVLIAAAPAALFGMWNVGYQHSLAIGDTGLNILGNFWYGFLKVLPPLCGILRGGSRHRVRCQPDPR